MTQVRKTVISQALPDRIEVRGYNVLALADSRSFSDMVYLLLRGELPSPEEARLVDAMLIIMAEHSINAPSAHVTRTVASSGSPLQTAVAAGISAIGNHHGGAGEALAGILYAAVAASPLPFDAQAAAAAVVADTRREKRRLPGYGHRIHNPDPRAVYLIRLAQKLGVAGVYAELAQAIEARLYAETGRFLPLNVDGALAALACDLGFDPLMAKGLFILARTAGLLAHAQEEFTTGRPMGFPGVEAADYVGPVRNSQDMG